jgi:hypothetical protein
MESSNEPPSFATETLEQKFAQLLIVAEFCLQARAITPILVLIYSAIDVAGWLYAANPTASTKTRFTDWVARYLLPAGNFDCSAPELYGARCGLVHNFTAASDLSRQLKVREILYAWGDSDIENLREMTKIANLQIPGRQPTVQYTAIRIEELISAFREGLWRFFEDARIDARLGARVVERSGKVLSTVSNQEVAALAGWVKERLNDS